MKKLQFNGPFFRIMLVGDPHEKPDDGSERAKNIITDYLNLQYAAVKELKPDLVILMGDNAKGSDPDELRTVLERITKPYKDNGVPFAFILGNHDLECPVNDLDTHYSVYKSLDGCVLGDYNRFGDYTLPVFVKDGGAPAFLLRLFYSGSNNDDPTLSKYHVIKKQQLDEYRKTARESKEKYGLIPAFAFQHIPVIEEYRLTKTVPKIRRMFDAVAGINGFKGHSFVLDKKAASGYLGEPPASPDIDSGEFSVWKQEGEIIAAFFGHDHMNDISGKVDGITLTQCKTAGFNVYGDGLMQGVRVLDIPSNDPREFTTRMVRYRSLVGKKALSVKGVTAVMPDRYSTKLDALVKALPVIGTAAFTLMAVRVYEKYEKR